MPHQIDYSENALVEQPAIELFEALGWEHANCYHEQPGPHSFLGRETRAEVVLVDRLRAALARLNPGLPPRALQTAIDELLRDRSVMPLVRANQDVYDLLKNGVRVAYENELGEEVVETVQIVDWTTPANNDFFLASQLWVTGELYTKRPDLVGFVNGLPLLLVEFKASDRRVREGYDKNLCDYRETIPHLFWYNAFVVISNGSESVVGSTTAPLEHFSDWKRLEEGEPGRVSLETLIHGTCRPDRLLDLVENFTLFSEEPGGLAKIVAKNHQALGVNNALRAVEHIEDSHGRLGVYWHTQGAGKSYSMIFFAQKVLRTLPGSWTFVVVTDRTDLDDQIYRNFTRAGVVTEDDVQARSAEHLRGLLREDHRYVFTLIHKFRTERGERHPLLSERSDIIVMVDEAHRTQYDVLAQNMRDALPNAAFIAFTGTPLVAGEEKTRQVFGDYISVYNFRQSVEDGATVPLWYENRIPELQLVNERFNEDMEQLLEEAMLDEEQEALLERQFQREYHLITRDDRLEKVAEDVVSHFMSRGFRGKAMVISIDRVTAARMYDKVQRHWQARIGELKAQLPGVDDWQREELLREIRYMEETDMAVIISSSQGEVQEFREHGLDILPHRRRMVSEDLDEKFKDPDHPLRLAFVCAMWMTGFDAKTCSTIYLDKPMRNHTLMQTIARANRVFADKPNGLIVDYIGVFRNLQKALAIYGTGGDGGGDMPIQDKSKLIEALEQAIEAATAFCTGLGIDLNVLFAAGEFDFIHLRDNAVNKILADEQTKQHYLGLARDVDRLFKAVLPHERAGEFGPHRAIFINLANRIRSLDPEVDIADVLGDVAHLLDESVAAEAYIIPKSGPNSLIDLSRLDFDALRERFEQGHKHIEVERLKAELIRKVEHMVRLNKSRADYQQRLQQLIDEYNAGAKNVEELFDELVKFTRDLSEEEQRHIAEQLSEEELALFDLLVKPGPELTKKERTEVKAVVRELLETLKQEKLVLDWRKRQQAKAAVQHSIAAVLDRLPNKYSRSLYEQKCVDVFQHVHESYPGEGRSVYGEAA